jgi:hypothetical protein
MASRHLSKMLIELLARVGKKNTRRLVGPWKALWAMEMVEATYGVAISVDSPI